MGNEVAAAEKDVAAVDVAAADVAAARKVIRADGKKELRPRGKGFLRLMGNDNVVAGKDIQLPENMLQLPEKMLQRFPEFFLKNDSKRKDQMQKEKKQQLYATTRNYLCTANTIFSLRIGKGREKFLLWCQLIIWIGSNL